LIIRKEKDGGAREFKYKLNSSKQPKWIDIDMGKRVTEGIYKPEGEELTICVVAGAVGGKASGRPTEFKASKEKVWSQFVLKRLKK
jgi:uncharacterized protein (TIGR03067 family)